MKHKKMNLTMKLIKCQCCRKKRIAINFRLGDITLCYRCNNYHAIARGTMKKHSAAAKKEN